jgi:hypothetical protein
MEPERRTVEDGSDADGDRDLSLGGGRPGEERRGQEGCHSGYAAHGVLLITRFHCHWLATAVPSPRDPVSSCIISVYLATR